MLIYPPSRGLTNTWLPRSFQSVYYGSGCFHLVSRVTTSFVVGCSWGFFDIYYYYDYDHLTLELIAGRAFFVLFFVLLVAIDLAWSFFLPPHVSSKYTSLWLGMWDFLTKYKGDGWYGSFSFFLMMLMMIHLRRLSDIYSIILSFTGSIPSVPPFLWMTAILSLLHTAFCFFSLFFRAASFSSPSPCFSFGAINLCIKVNWQICLGPGDSCCILVIPPRLPYQLPGF